MKPRHLLVVLFFWLLTMPAHAGDPLPIPDPDKFSDAIMTDLALQHASEVAAKISETLGVPEQKSTIESTLKFIVDKKINYRKKVLDRDIAGALRQIVHYTYTRGIGFVYFRFNYKQTDSGWILAHFTFASEVNELFPPGMNLE